MRAYACILLCFTGSLCAGEAHETIESLLAAHWAPHAVQVDWTFAADIAPVIEHDLNWAITSPLPERPCGAMILKLTATDSSATTRTMIVSGRADIMVHCLTVNRTISVGDLINSEAVSPVDVMWKAAYGEPLSSADVSGEQRAARALVPGRPLCLNDVRNSKSVQPGEKITLRLSQGTVDITLAAHALTGGAIGDEISATVVGNPPRTFRGILESEGHLHVQLP